MEWGNNREEDNRKVPEKKLLRFPKTADITLETWIGFIVGLTVQGEVDMYFKDLIVFSQGMAD